MCINVIDLFILYIYIDIDVCVYTYFMDVYVCVYIYIIDVCMCVCVCVCVCVLVCVYKCIYSGAADYGRILTMVDLAGAIDEAGMYFCTRKASKLLPLLAFLVQKYTQ